MTEGYTPRTGSLDEEGGGKLSLKEASADEVLFALQFGMIYKGGKHRGRQAHEIAIRAVAQMAYDQLKQSGYVIMKEPHSGAMDLTRYMQSKKIPMKE